MSIKFVRGAGNSVEPAAVNLPASGVVIPGCAVEFSRTGGKGVYHGSKSTTATMIFGVTLDLAEGTSDSFARVIPFVPGQLWEVDCNHAVSTAQIGLGMTLGEEGDTVNNESTDIDEPEGVFRCLAITGSESGSGKLIGEFTRSFYRTEK